MRELVPELLRGPVDGRGRRNLGAASFIFPEGRGRRERVLRECSRLRCSRMGPVWVATCTDMQKGRKVAHRSARFDPTGAADVPLFLRMVKQGCAKACRVLSRRVRTSVRAPEGYGQFRRTIRIRRRNLETNWSTAAHDARGAPRSEERPILEALVIRGSTPEASERCVLCYNIVEIISASFTSVQRG